MGISAGGLISGIDTDSLISSLIAIERQPITDLQTKEADYQAKISAYGSIKSALSNLKTSVSSLTDTDNFTEGYKASSSDTSYIEVASEDGVSSGTYSLIVSQLATSEQMSGNTYSDSTDTVGTGTLHFKLENGDKFDVDISSSSNTLADIATAINDADADVSASVLMVNTNDYRLSISAKDTGQTINYSYQEEGFTFSTSIQESSSVGEKIKSEGFAAQDTALSLTGTLSVNGTDIALTGTETLQDIQSSVDALANITASISYDSTTSEYSLEIENDTAEGSVELNFYDATASTGLSNLIDSSATQAAKKALVNFNGIDITRTSNSISDLVTGLTVDLMDADNTKTITVSVQGNYDTLSGKITDFTEKYNSVIETLNQLQSYGGEDGTSGTLIGDSTARLLESGMRSIMFNSFSTTNNTYSTIDELGITVGTDGKLSFNQSTFESEMAAHESDVISFFTTDSSSSSDGFAVNFENYLNGYLDSDGILSAKEDGYNSSIESLQDEEARIETRVSKTEETLRNQFNSLEQLLSGYQSTQTYLTAQLSSLYGSK